MKLVTVIIPVYKVEEYLEKCVKSIQKQTYTNLEIILVDDGSPDESGSMCDALSRTDPRIRVIHQENMGLSGARNSALDIMQGDVVTFVDSDDTVDNNMVENLLKDMEEYDADIVECQFYEVFGNRRDVQGYLKETKAYSAEQALLIDLGAKGGSVAACGKLYRRHIFAEHRFEVGRIGEDAFAIIGSLRQANRIVIDHRPMYYYYHRNNSITTKGFSEKTLDEIEGAKRNLEIVKKEFPKAIPGAMFRYDWSYLWVLDRILLDEQWRKNRYLEGIMRHIRKHFFRIIKSPYFTRNRKIGAAMASISPGIYRKIVIRTWSRKWK
jgi:Glycosyltransferases, probably involved in cell wall biogenesis